MLLDVCISVRLGKHSSKVTMELNFVTALSILDAIGREMLPKVRAFGSAGHRIPSRIEKTSTSVTKPLNLDIVVNPENTIASRFQLSAKCRI